MFDSLKRLRDFLYDNNYTQEALCISDAITEYEKNGFLSEFSIKKIKAMCTPKYLGNLYIKEFQDPYEWWNFLAEIKNSIDIVYNL